jgi:hypothetical protein
LFNTINAASGARSITIDVTGFGVNYDEAKDDAIKKALQAAFKQLIVVDRIVSNDKVIRDRILSTSNGYVENYMEKSARKTNSGVIVEAAITLSASRVENFLGLVAGGGGEFSGKLLSRAIQKRKAQEAADRMREEVNGEILSRLFENYPWSAYDVSLHRIDLSDSDSDKVILTLDAKFNDRFVKSLKSTIDALADYKCPNLVGKHGASNPYPSECKLTYKRDGKNPAHREQYDFICVIDYCAFFKAKFCSNCGVWGLRSNFKRAELLLLVGRFVDSAGRSAHVNNDCITVRPRDLKGILAVTKWNYSVLNFNLYDRVGLAFNIYNGIRFRVEIDSSEINLGRADKFISVLVPDKVDEYSRVRDNRVKGITGNRIVNSCRLVDEAVRKVLVNPG